MAASIGIIRTRYLGDMILLLPLIREIQAFDPLARVTVVANEGTTYPLERFPGVSVLTMATSGKIRRLLSTLSVANAFRSHSPDILLDLTVSDRSRFLARAVHTKNTGAAGAPEDHKKGDPWRTYLPVDLNHGPDHVTVQFGKLLSLFGIPMTGIREKSYAPDPMWVLKAKSWLESRRCQDSPILFLHPGGRHWFKRWPSDRFGRLADRWVSQTKGTVIVAGTSSEKTLVESVLSNTKTPGIHSLIGSPVGLLDALIRHATVFVGNDSGPLHMADAAHIPLVGLFGSTLPSVWGPTAAPRREVVYQHLPCSPCAHVGCSLGEKNCMASIKVEEVQALVEKVLA